MKCPNWKTIQISIEITVVFKLVAFRIGNFGFCKPLLFFFVIFWIVFVMERRNCRKDYFLAFIFFIFENSLKFFLARLVAFRTANTNICNILCIPSLFFKKSVLRLF